MTFLSQMIKALFLVADYTKNKTRLQSIGAEGHTPRPKNTDNPVKEEYYPTQGGGDIAC